MAAAFTIFYVLLALSSAKPTLRDLTAHHDDQMQSDSISAVNMADVIGGHDESRDVEEGTNQSKYQVSDADTSEEGKEKKISMQRMKGVLKKLFPTTSPSGEVKSEVRDRNVSATIQVIDNQAGEKIADEIAEDFEEDMDDDSDSRDEAVHEDAVVDRKPRHTNAEDTSRSEASQDDVYTVLVDGGTDRRTETSSLSSSDDEEQYFSKDVAEILSSASDVTESEEDIAPSDINDLTQDSGLHHSMEDDNEYAFHREPREDRDFAETDDDNETEESI